MPVVFRESHPERQPLCVIDSATAEEPDVGTILGPEKDALFVHVLEVVEQFRHLPHIRAVLKTGLDEFDVVGELVVGVDGAEENGQGVAVWHYFEAR